MTTCTRMRSKHLSKRYFQGVVLEPSVLARYFHRHNPCLALHLRCRDCEGGFHESCKNLSSADQRKAYHSRRCVLTFSRQLRNNEGPDFQQWRQDQSRDSGVETWTTKSDISSGSKGRQHAERVKRSLENFRTMIINHSSEVDQRHSQDLAN